MSAFEANSATRLLFAMKRIFTRVATRCVANAMQEAARDARRQGIAKAGSRRRRTVDVVMGGYGVLSDKN